MRLTIVATALLLSWASAAAAQTPPPAPPVQVSPAPNAADVASADAILATLYDVISGDAGVQRDWNRFRSLFHPSASLIPIGGPAAGPATATFLTPDGYITAAEAFLMRGFHERELARRTETFGHMTHVFSTYDSRRAASDAEPFARGINSVQLLDDGTRWWILSVYWQGETPQIPLPPAYLPAP